jgi:hypothetical protein
MIGNQPSILRPDRARCCVTRLVHNSPGHPIVAGWGQHFGPDRGSSKPDGPTSIIALATIRCHASTASSCNGQTIITIPQAHGPRQRRIRHRPLSPVPRPTQRDSHSSTNLFARPLTGVPALDAPATSNGGVHDGPLPRVRPALAGMYTSLPRSTSMRTPAAKLVTLSSG